MVDVAGNDVWPSADPRHVLDPGGRNTVEILAPDRHAHNKVSEGGTELADGSLESCYLIVDAGLSARAPQTEKEGCLGIDGSLDGLGRGVGCAGLDHGVEASTGEAAGAYKILSSREVILILLLGHGRVVCVCSSIVEALYKVSVSEGLHHRPLLGFTLWFWAQTAENEPARARRVEVSMANKRMCPRSSTGYLGKRNMIQG